MERQQGAEPCISDAIMSFILFSFLIPGTGQYILQNTAATLSFYKWCSKHRQEIHSVYVECIENELARFGLQPYKINHNMDCLVKFKNKAEAIIQIGACEVNLLIYKL